MNKRGKIAINFVFFIIVFSIVFFLQIKESASQIPEDIEPAKAQKGFGGGGLLPEQSKKSESILQNNITPDLASNQSEKVQIPVSRQYIDPEILKEFNKSSKITILIKVRDTSGISVSRKDTIEEQTIKDLIRKEFLENKTSVILSTLLETEFKLESKLPLGNGFGGNITKQGFDNLINNPDIKAIYLDKPLHIVLDESRSLINADDVESAGYNGTHQTVCVIDTGIDYDHAALGGCFGATCKVRGGYDYYNTDADPDDDNGHGTNVAGIIASTDSTYEGIAPDARLVAMKVCNSAGTSCPQLKIVSALQYCYQNRGIYNISAVSISIADGGEYPPSCPTWADDEINDLYNVDIPVIVASGNNGHTNGISYPACSSNATSVGAVYDENIGSQTWSSVPCTDSTTSADKITCFTNRKNGVLDLLAPGCRSTAPEAGGGFDYQCGTSQAAPHVSGTVALLKQLNKTLTTSQIETSFKNTGVTVGDYKRIDALAALNSIRDKDSDGYYDESYSGNDCNDNNAAVNPGATEVCDDIDNDCDDTIDEGCTEECSEPGYEQCSESSFGDCDVSIAVNYYTNVNNIQWGVVNDSSDPYVINEYKVGWKDVDAERMYYDVNDPNNDCDYDGCTGTSISGTGTRVATNAPATASTENLLGHSNTASYWCTVWFNGFNPNYGSSNAIYVLNCFNNSHCSASQYCDKSGSWSSWNCVAKKSDGQSCTQDFQCSSNYCDNDGIGLSDDGWCFTPYSTYFDGQENTYCEYSTDNGIADCDERQTGIDLDKCIGTSYYEEECSSTCAYQDVTSVFECTDTGCSCTESLCDGLTTGSSIATCSYNQTYFADKCTSIAGGEDRTDDICRSSTFASGCTANSQCNGVTAGANTENGSCSLTCTFDAFPNVTLISPQNNNVSTTGDILFNCSATDDKKLINITLYQNISGIWKANETKALSGTSDSESFTINDIPDELNFIWNCRSYDNVSQSDWGNTNYTSSVNLTQIAGNITIISLQSIYSNNTLRVFEFIISNTGEKTITNVTWKLNTGNSYTINSTYGVSLQSNENILHFVEYNYTGQGTYTIIVNATNNTISDIKTLGVNIGDLLITSFDDLNINGLDVVFEAQVQNNLESNITDINWSLNTKDNSIINATSLFNLTSNKTVFVYTAYQYGSGGSYAPSFTASNPSYSDTKTASVSTNSPPTITTIPDITFNEDNYNDTLNLSNYVSDAEDSDAALTWTMANNINITITINQTTKIVNFTALANWSGSENIKFTVNDTSGLTDNDTILVTVNPVNDPPSFNSSNPASNLIWPEDTINSSINLTKHFYDIDNSNLNFTATNTQNVSIYIQNITGLVNITPNANWTGTAYAVFTAIDNAGLTASSNNITLNVTAVNDRPTFNGTIPQWKWPEDIVNSSLNLTQYFSDIDDGSLSYNFTIVNNMAISINNNTGIVTFTPSGNFTGIRNTTFFAIDVENLTIPSNNVTLNVTAVNDMPSIDTFTPTALAQTIVLGNSLTLNHTSSDIDGDTLTYKWKLDETQKSTEQGWKFTPAENELGNHNVTLNISDGTANTTLQWNVSVINQSDINVYDLSVLNQNSTVSIFGFGINNTGNSNISGINWSLNTGQNTILANSLFTLQPNESIFVFAGYNYTASGEYTVTATATNNTHIDSESIVIDISDIELINLTALNISGTNAIFEFAIENTLLQNLTNVNWTFDTKNSNAINATSNFILTPSEKLFVYLDYNFTSTGTFNVNATARNGTLTDSMNLTITI